MNLDYNALFIQFPTLGVIGLIVWWFYPDIKARTSEARIDAKENSQKLVELVEKSTEAIINNTITMANNNTILAHLITLVEKIENKK